MIDLKDKCSGCMACYNICKFSAISIEYDKKGFAYPKVNKTKCVDCKKCENVCPQLNNKNYNNFPIKVYAAVNKDKYVRKNSSSGGIFYSIAKNIINDGGIVIGAAFDEEYNLFHEIIDNQKALEKLMKSKYVQSNIGDIYIKTESELKKGRKVLFSGTPCQVSGLCLFLNKEYENLITLDIICHGVPSPLVWKKYLSYIACRYNDYPREVNFRDKAFGWRLYSLSVKYRVKHMKINSFDPYLMFFSYNLSIRESCFQCNSKGTNRLSDITIGDCWGIEKIKPRIDDDKGVSCVFVNSSVGLNILESLDDISKYEISKEDVIRYNPAYNSSSKKKYKV